MSARETRLSVAITALAMLLGFGCSSAPLAEQDGAASGGSSSGPVGGGDAGATPAEPSVPAYEPQRYPEGPYGTAAGSVLENFEFLGWREPKTSNYDLERLEVVRLGDFYDPDGDKGIRYIVLNASAVWCSVCQAEMSDIRERDVFREYRDKGVLLVGTLFEDNQYGPAKPSDLRLWGSLDEHAIEFPLLLDPGFKLGRFFTSDATPLNLLVDARSMRVVAATMGYSQSYWQQIDELLAE